MNRKLLKQAVAVITAGTLLCMPIGADEGATDAAVQSYEDQLEAYKAKQQQALNELADIRSSQSEAWMEVSKYDELLKYNNEVKKLAEGELDSLATKITDKEQLIADTEAAIEQQEEAFLNRMVAVYMEDDTDMFELLFGSTSLSDFLSRMDRVNAIFDYDNDIIENLENNRERLEEEKIALDEDQARQKERVADYEEVIAQDQQIYEAKLAYIDSLEADESSLIEEYTYYKQLESELNTELEELLAELAREQERQRQEAERLRQEEEERKRLEAEQSQTVSDGQGWNDNNYETSYTTTYTYSGGSFYWPLEDGVSYYVSSEQGWRTYNGISEYHLGIDLACACGTTVLAAASGTVLRSEYHASYGNYVLIDHGGGISTLYAHMSSCAVSAGDYVEAGQTVGWVGLTGNTSGYHLHFETRENGSTVNPRGYLVFP